MVAASTTQPQNPIAVRRGQNTGAAETQAQHHSCGLGGFARPFPYFSRTAFSVPGTPFLTPPPPTGLATQDTGLDRVKAGLAAKREEVARINARLTEVQAELEQRKTEQQHTMALRHAVINTLSWLAI